MHIQEGKLSKQIQFRVNSKDQLHERICEYFESAGFKETFHEVNRLSFKKPSRLLSSWTFNPINWESKVDVSIRNLDITAEFFVDGTAEILSPHEIAMWDAFIDNFERFILADFNYNDANEEVLQGVKRDGWKYVGIACLGTITGGLAGEFLSWATNLNFPFQILGIIGAIVFINRQKSVDRSKAAM